MSRGKHSEGEMIAALKQVEAGRKGDVESSDRNKRTDWAGDLGGKVVHGCVTLMHIAFARVIGQRTEPYLGLGFFRRSAQEPPATALALKSVRV